MFIVCDLDDTLADNAHRQHILEEAHESESAKWDAFFEPCDKDVVMPEIAEIFQALTNVSQGNRVEIWTARSESVRDKTERWLRRNLFDAQSIPLRMRAKGDVRPDTEVKGDWMEKYGKPQLVFDDRNKMVDWWRAQGIVCCQVKESDY